MYYLIILRPSFGYNFPSDHLTVGLLGLAQQLLRFASFRLWSSQLCTMPMPPLGDERPSGLAGSFPSYTMVIYPLKMVIYPIKMVIFNSYVNVYQRVSIKEYHQHLSVLGFVVQRISRCGS